MPLVGTRFVRIHQAYNLHLFGQWRAIGCSSIKQGVKTDNVLSAERVVIDNKHRFAAVVLMRH